ncbi:MAG TPA: hypothetical protein VKE73_10115 [Myxococcota bacterium]|nr:hypothetical protein [Myxococcota bacterium]
MDGKDLGETPIAGALLSPGNHVFRAQMPDGDVIERTLQIGAGTRHIAFPAGPAPPSPKELVSPPAEQPGTQTPASQVATTRIAVGINATPWATIEVDGVEVGETPIAGIPLAPGSHLFRARMPDGRVIEKTVEIGAETRYVTFQ